MLFQSLHILTKTLTITPKNSNLNKHFFSFTTLRPDNSFQTFWKTQKLKEEKLTEEELKTKKLKINLLRLKNMEKYTSDSDNQPKRLNSEEAIIGWVKWEKSLVVFLTSKLIYHLFNDRPRDSKGNIIGEERFFESIKRHFNWRILSHRIYVLEHDMLEALVLNNWIHLISNKTFKILAANINEGLSKIASDLKCNILFQLNDTTFSEKSGAFILRINSCIVMPNYLTLDKNIVFQKDTIFLYELVNNNLFFGCSTDQLLLHTKKL